MPVLYGGEAIVPAPLVTISKQILTGDDGELLGQTYQITLEGSLVAVPPGTSGVATDARLGVLLAKQNILSALFKVSGANFEVYSPDGSQVTKCNPKVVSIEYAKGIWVDKTDYTIVLEAPTLYADDFVPTQDVTDTHNSWQIEEAGFTTDNGIGLKPVWQLTHTVSATGKLVYDLTGNVNIPWQEARDYVVTKLSQDTFANQPFDSSGELNLVADTAYNHTRVEEVDEINGSFSVTEKWLMALGLPATEDYTISVHITPEEAIGTVVTVAGTIHGLATGLNQLQTRITNAITYYNSSVKNNLVVRANNAVPGTTLSDYGTGSTLDYNYGEGTISYSWEFNDKITPVSTDTVYDTYTVSRKLAMTDVETTVTVSGTILGRLRTSEPQSVMTKYLRAKTYFDAFGGNTTIVDRANSSNVFGLQPAPVDDSVDFNFGEGSISYSYSFNNRANNTALNEYTVDLKTSKEESRATITVAGTISGFRLSDSDPITTKYNNALAFWATWVPEIYTTAAVFGTGITLNTIPNSISRGDNPRTGVINYSFEFNTDSIPTIPNAISQQTTISKTNAGDVFASIPVLGRAVGPVLQTIGTITATSISVTIEYVMPRSSSEPNIDGIINGYAPSAGQVYVERDESSWNPNISHGSRTKSWVYQ